MTLARTTAPQQLCSPRTHRSLQSRIMSSAYRSCTFEVFGKVQGVFFRANTKDKADALGIVGFCRNTEEGSVAGEIQGEPAPFYEMKEWLKHTGSPGSKIERAEFGDEKKLSEQTYSAFEVR